jgi:hypothetical protein
MSINKFQQRRIFLFSWIHLRALGIFQQNFFPSRNGKWPILHFLTFAGLLSSFANLFSEEKLSTEKTMTKKHSKKMSEEGRNDFRYRETTIKRKLFHYFHFSRTMVA